MLLSPLPQVPARAGGSPKRAAPAALSLEGSLKKIGLTLVWNSGVPAVCAKKNSTERPYAKRSESFAPTRYDAARRGCRIRGRRKSLPQSIDGISDGFASASAVVGPPNGFRPQSRLS